MKRKLVTVLFAGAMVMALTACGSTANGTESTAQTEDATEDTSGNPAAEESGNGSEDGDGETSGANSGEEKEDTPETVVIQSLNGSGEEIDLEVAYRPERVAILDMACLDIIDSLEEGSCVVGSASTSLDYLQDYVTNEDIAPVIYLSTDTEAGVVESVRKNAQIIASIFGKEDQVDTLMRDFDERIQTLSAFAEGKTAIIGMCTSGSFNVLGNDGRCSLIGREIGFENIGVDADADTSTHGNEASFEFVTEKNPDYIFVMDRDAAIATEGAQLAQDIMENELVQGTDAYKNGHLIYLAHPAVWYTAEGGIQALDIMLQDLETELLQS